MLGLNEEGTFAKGASDEVVDSMTQTVDTAMHAIVKSGTLCLAHTCTEKALSALEVSYPSFPLAPLFISGVFASLFIQQRNAYMREVEKEKIQYTFA